MDEDEEKIIDLTLLKIRKYIFIAGAVTGQVKQQQFLKKWDSQMQ